MILSDSEVEQRLESPDNLINKIEHRLPVVAITRREHDNPGHIGNRMRELIGNVANKGTDSQNEIAAVFGVGKGTVNTASRGLNSNGSLNTELREKIKAREEKIDTAHDEALDLMVNCITSLKDKIKEVEKPERLSKIASDMGKIIGSLKDKDEDKAPKQVVILYKPEIRSEKEYEVIEA